MTKCNGADTASLSRDEDGIGSAGVGATGGDAGAWTVGSCEGVGAIRAATGRIDATGTDSGAGLETSTSTSGAGEVDAAFNGALMAPRGMPARTPACSAIEPIKAAAVA